MADWSLLPNDLLELIVGHLETSFEIVLFRSVCRSWRSVVPPLDHSRCLGIKTHDISFNAGFSFSDQPTDQPPFKSSVDCTLKNIPIYLVKFWTPYGDDYLLAEMREREGGEPKLLLSPLSSNGIKYGMGINQVLFNSLTSPIIPFGQYYEITYFKKQPIRYRYGLPYHLWNEVEWVETSERVEFLRLHSEDSRDFAVLFAGRMCNLVMYRSRNMSWTQVVEHPETYAYQDLVAFKGKFYALDSSGSGRVFIVDLSLRVTEIPSVKGSQYYSKESLVQLGEELLLVQRFIPAGRRYDEYIYTWFKVFRLDEGGKRKWVQVNYLNDRVIFLGARTKLCCSVHKLPGANENCIVFLASNDGSIFDNDSVLLFDLKTRRTNTAFNECKGYMGVFGANLKSLVSCGLVTIPNPTTRFLL
ncbi:F-box-like domain superfamily [Arabidopsis suecica]|uniref:F-box-like domain superfamily n=1 Tax=Arabidopsis suecica TaxID=45249 RepID=A0A8T2G0D3_ARASU|nr:F-box-like domain superfamily [Arabidopsis suecica]